MEDFADLIDALIYTTSRNAKLRLISDYLRETPDPDRAGPWLRSPRGWISPRSKVPPSATC